MAERTKQHTTPHALDAFSNFEDHELRSTMRDFLEEEEKEKSSIWNVATIAGIAMFLVSMLYVVQLLTQATPGLSELMTALPVFGAILVAFVGFGFFVGDRKKVKNARKKKNERRKDYFEKEFPASQFDSDEDVDLEKELLGRSKSSGKTGKTRFSRNAFDSYALSQPKKLYKSRTDKKWLGVCGGLGKYFGMSPKIIRFLFFFTFIVGWGAPLLIYIALAFALEKEPPELMDHFDF